MACFYLSLLGNFEDQALSALESDCKATFLGLVRDVEGEYTDAGKEALLCLAFAKEGKVDKLGDPTYIEVEGKGKFYLPHAIGNSQVEIQEFDIEGLDVDSVSFRLDKNPDDSGICHVEIDNLVFTLKITKPVELSISIRFDLNVSVAVNKEEDSSSGDYWNYNPYEAFELDATLEGVSLPHYEFHLVESAILDDYRIAKYGDYERIWGYTISFDSNGGSSIDHIVVGFGDGISTSNLPIPTKGDYPFKGWFTKDGEPVDRYLTLNEDITLYARFFEDEAPNELEGEIYSRYKLACLLKENALEESKADVQVQDLFRSETASKALFDMMLFLNGETDYFGTPSYIMVGENNKYDEDYSSSHVFAADEISGKGWATYSEESEDSTKPTYKYLKLEALSYRVIIDSTPVYVSSFNADLETWYEEGSDEYYAIALTIKVKNELNEEVSHSFKLFCNTNKGVYDDYYFDSTRYNVTT